MSALAQAFRDQALACSNLGSPFMGRLLNFLAENWPEDTETARKCLTFSGDLGPASVSLPLRIAGGLHALRLLDRAGLAEIYPPHSPDNEKFGAAVLRALRDEDTFLADWIKSPPQTNELRRSVVLIPGAHLVSQRFNLPLVLSELGASGGLNLMWDQFALETGSARLGPERPAVTLRPDWEGPAPIANTPVIAERRGVDLNPLNPTDPDDFLRMTAYLWPDQPERLANTRAAAGSVPAPVDRGDAIDWLEHRLDSAPEGHVHLIQNTIAWQYFPEDVQARGIEMIERAGANATETRPLAWLQLETDGDKQGEGGAPITLRMWPSGETLVLGRADFHGRWVRWQGA